MFSGIVESIGTIIHLDMQNGCQHFKIHSPQPLENILVGESIAINGVCLTVTEFDGDTFNVTAVPETLRVTNLGHLKLNDLVNLERSLQMGARIGGHYVQGHVDCVGTIIEMEKDNSDALLVKIAVKESIAKYIVAKGYITLDGMSITVIATAADWFTVTFIPHTQAVTITKNYKIGTSINIEVDIMGKYVEKSLGAYLYANKN